MDEERLRVEALRVYHRYATEVIEPLGLCPWAKQARLGGRVGHRVEFGTEPTPEDVLVHVDSVARDEKLHIGLIIFPRLELGAREFGRFVSRVRQADVARFPPGESPLFMADFHPMGRLDKSAPSRLVAFIRRSPDPTIQLVRRSVLEDVRRNESRGTFLVTLGPLVPDQLTVHDGIPLHEKIAESNHKTIGDFGFERLSALMEDIRRDRDRAYARLRTDDEH